MVVVLDESVFVSGDIVPLLIESLEFIGIVLWSVVVVVGSDVEGSIGMVDGVLGDVVPGVIVVPGEVCVPGVVVCASAADERPRAAMPSIVAIRMKASFS